MGSKEGLNPCCRDAALLGLGAIFLHKSLNLCEGVCILWPKFCVNQAEGGEATINVPTVNILVTIENLGRWDVGMGEWCYIVPLQAFSYTKALTRVWGCPHLLAKILGQSSRQRRGNCQCSNCQHFSYHWKFRKLRCWTWGMFLFVCFNWWMMYLCKPFLTQKP